MQTAARDLAELVRRGLSTTSRLCRVAYRRWRLVPSTGRVTATPWPLRRGNDKAARGT
jgi:hypothetical protein